MDKVIELAKQAGAVSYTNRHYPDRPYRTFGPEELHAFYTLARADLEAENAKLKDALSNALPYIGQALAEHDNAYGRHPATEPERASIQEDIDAARAALGEK